MTGRPKIVDWDVPQPLATGLAAPLWVPLAVPLVLGAVIAALGSPIVGAVLGLLPAVAFWLWSLGQGRRVLKQLGVRPLAAEDEPRLAKLVAGEAADLGTKAASLWVLDSADANAAVVWASGPHIVVTEGLRQELTLSEQEAVVAHCLVRLATGEARRATAALALGPLGSNLTYVGPALDVRAAAATRYPPALASAIRKCVPASGPLGALWFVAQGPSHEGQEDRAVALADL